AATAFVALATVTGLVFGGNAVVGAVRDGGARPRPAPAGGEEAHRRQVEGAPLLLVGHEGWRVSRADQNSTTIGEVTFTNGEREVELNWRPASDHDAFVDDRAREASGEWDVEIARRHGKLFRYEGTTDFTTVWRDGDLSLELRGVFPNVHAYRAIADTLDRVDEETWLAALPNDTVTPAGRPATVDEMLGDVPIHPSVDVDELKQSPSVSDRYQLGARVTAAVACAWIEQWVEGDASEKREATNAMSTARRWSILREMERDGAWSEVLWEYADAMAGDGQVAGGGPTTLEESYRDGLGCDG
ncbi:MAG: hypothetical protein M3134_02775, partial [Actinomycetota bacterium]|nr:hypothetical protein [Actinomycetota bacterium]